MDGFVECLRQAYGDLQRPDHRRVSEVLRRAPYTALFRRIESLEHAEDVSDFSYDLCFTYRTQEVDLLLSAVGPYFLVVADGGVIVDGCGRVSAQLVAQSGFRRVTYDEATSQVALYDIDSASTTTTLVRALFTLQDRTFVSATGLGARGNDDS